MPSFWKCLGNVTSSAGKSSERHSEKKVRKLLARIFTLPRRTVRYLRPASGEPNDTRMILLIFPRFVRRLSFGGGVADGRVPTPGRIKNRRNVMWLKSRDTAIWWLLVPWA